MLHQALGLIDNHFGDLDMALGRLIERRTDYLSLYQSLHVCDFLRSFIYEQDNQYNLGVISGNTVGDILEEHCLAGSGRCDDKSSLALTDWSHKIHYPGGIVV